VNPQKQRQTVYIRLSIIFYFNFSILFYYLCIFNNTKKSAIHCEDILTSNQCESSVISDLNLLCVWGSDSLGYGICAEKNTLICNDYLTMLGCTWSEINDSDLKSVCKWDENKSPQCINSLECGDLKEEGLICEDFKSQKGQCFFNGEGRTTTHEKSCSNAIEITNCNQFTSYTLCSFSNRTMYTELPGKLLFPCSWDVMNSECKFQEDVSNVYLFL
jgi:hypothetical protein